MKKPYIITIAVIALVLIVSIILWLNSFSLALRFAGLSMEGDIVFRGYDTLDHEIRVIRASSKDHELLLATITRNGLGIWTVTGIDGDHDIPPDTVVPHPNIIFTGWFGSGGFYRFSHTDTGVYTNEWNALYAGNTAIKRIEFLPGQIPDGIAVDIRQTGSEYSVRLVAYGDEEPAWSGIDIHALLVKNGCVESK